MREEQREFFELMDAFRKLKVSCFHPGVRHMDFGVMKSIDMCRKQNDSGKVTVSDICRDMKLPPPAVSRCLRMLEHDGRIERTVNKDDRRNTYVELTESGEEVVNESGRKMAEFADAVFGNMGEENMRKLNSYFKQLVQAAQEEIEKMTETTEREDR